MHLVHKRILLSDEGRKLTECEAHMRRANQRQFKDEFIPRMTWEGMKEGYYQGRKRVRNSQLQRLISRSISTRFG